MISGWDGASLFRVWSRWASKCNTMYETKKVRISGKNRTKPTRLVNKPGSISKSAASKINTPFRTGTVGVSPRSNCRFNSIQHRTPARRARNAPSNPPTSTLNTVNQLLRKESIKASSTTGISTSGSAIRQNRKVALLKKLENIVRRGLPSIGKMRFYRNWGRVAISVLVSVKLLHNGLDRLTSMGCRPAILVCFIKAGTLNVPLCPATL